MQNRNAKRTPHLLGGLVAAVLLGGCLPDPPSISAVDSGVDVVIDQTIPFVTSKLRFGNFVASAGPVDLCIKASGSSTWVGPIGRTIGQRAGGVYYQAVSQYLTVDAGSYTVKAVPGARTDCTIAYGGIPDMPLPAMGGGRVYTLAPYGTLSKPLEIKIHLFEDDPNTQGGQARVRFINLSQEVPSADFGLGTLATYTPLLKDAVSGDLGRTGGQVYATVSPQTNGTSSVRASGTSNDLLTTGPVLTFSADAVHSLMLSGLASKSPPDPLSLKLLICEDSKAPQSGLSVCTLLN